MIRALLTALFGAQIPEHEKNAPRPTEYCGKTTAGQAERELYCRAAAEELAPTDYENRLALAVLGGTDLTAVTFTWPENHRLQIRGLYFRDGATQVFNGVFTSPLYAEGIEVVYPCEIPEQAVVDKINEEIQR